MKRKEGQVGFLRDPGAGLAGAPDLARTRQEHEDVAIQAVDDELPHGRRDLRRERAIVRGRDVLDRDVEEATLRPEDGRAEVPRERRRRERRAHGHDQQVRARRSTQAFHQRQRHVALQVPLVELVQDDRRHPVEPRRRDEPPPEDALGHEANARPGARHVLEAHLVADRASEASPELFGDAPRGHPCRERRRGSSTTISPCFARPASEERPRERAWSFLPRGGASSTSVGQPRKDATIAGRSGSIGRGCIEAVPVAGTV